MSEWEKVKLQDVIDLIRNGTTDYQSDNVSEYPVTRIETISQGIIDYDRVRYLEKAKPEFQLISGDILYSHINSIQHIGKTAQYFAEKPLYHGMNLMLLRVKDGIDARFIFYILNTEAARRHSKNEAKPAINQASLGQNEILRFSFELPSLLTEQRKIVRILTTVDAVIEKTEAAIAKYEAIKKGMMADLFTRGIDPATGKLRPRYEDAPELYQETELGWVPKDWEVVKIARVTSLVTNGFVGTATPYYETSDNGIIYLYGTNIRPNRITFDDVRYVSRAFHTKQSKSQLSVGDMLTVQSGHIGTTAVIPESFREANCHALILTRFVLTEIFPWFASYYLNSDIGMKGMERLFVGSTIKHINTSELATHQIIKPKLEEQKMISKRLDTIEKFIRAEQNVLSKYNNLKQGLMADLLTGRVRVQVAAEMAEVSNG